MPSVSGLTPVLLHLSIISLLFALPSRLTATTPDRVAIVVNTRSAASREIAEYYVQRRSIPRANVCLIQTSEEETVSRETYTREIEQPLSRWLQSRKLSDKVLYLVTTLGVPLRVQGKTRIDGDNASVDSELTLLYSVMQGRRTNLPGAIDNPFFAEQQSPFDHKRFPIYLVTRLAAYTVPEVKSAIDRGLKAQNRGKVVIDLRVTDQPGDEWLRRAAAKIPKDRLILDQTHTPLYDHQDVIAFVSWGSNDPNRKQRRSGFGWLPGAIVSEFVSTNGRTFQRPPEKWTSSDNWRDTRGFFAGSPQSLSADYISEGATGVSGHVDEPYLQATPRPELLLPAYLGGRNLAESFYLAMPALSWQNIVIGDPLCRLSSPGTGPPAGKPKSR